MKVAILGYGVEGQAAAIYWGATGAEITVCDRNRKLKVPAQYSSKLGDDYCENLASFDLIVRSQSVRYDGAGNVTSGINEFFAQCPATIIGITGTKGKGTTASLIAAILKHAGMPYYLAGNIGSSPLELLGHLTSKDTVVLELSSTQLFDIKYSPKIAVCLMIAPDHQDWHRGMKEYIESKGNLFRYQSKNDLAIAKFGDRNSESLAELSPGKQLRYGGAPSAFIRGERIYYGDIDIMPTSEVALVGDHNLENVCAAITATFEYIKGDTEALKKAVRGFHGLEHRLEKVAVIAGVSYYDDSFSTNPDTAMAAIKAFPGDKVIILGGSSKKADFRGLAQVVQDNRVIHALLIGEETESIAAALESVKFNHFTRVRWTAMQDLVYTIHHLTEPGDVVLLSPACASFDLFRNYKDRGNQFKAAVRFVKERVDGNKP